MKITNEIIKKAFENKEFIIYYQPKIRVADNQIIGAEALVRWKKQSSFYLPDEFIPFFEHTEMICKLDLYVLESVCYQIRQWMIQGIKAIPISINLSRIDFNDESFCLNCLAVIKKYHIPFNLLEFEITESAFSEETEILQKSLTIFKRFGINISLDDFGVGYSTFYLLKNIVVNCIKLDRKFLCGPINQRMKDIITCIINLTEALNINLICEGVESSKQKELLILLNCKYAQGYYFYRPMPVFCFERLFYSLK